MSCGLAPCERPNCAFGDQKRLIRKKRHAIWRSSLSWENRSLVKTAKNRTEILVTTPRTTRSYGHSQVIATPFSLCVADIHPAQAIFVEGKHKFSETARAHVFQDADVPFQQLDVCGRSTWCSRHHQSGNLISVSS